MWVIITETLAACFTSTFKMNTMDDVNIMRHTVGRDHVDDFAANDVHLNVA